MIGASTVDGAAPPAPAMSVMDGMLASSTPASPSVVRPIASGRLKPSRGEPI